MNETVEQKKSVREIRVNPVVPSESVLVATARSMRPKKEEPPVPHDARAHVETCPFCKGNEAMTPPAIAQIPSQGDWNLRIVENLYPVLDDDREDPNFAFGLQHTINGYGRHEVVIDHSSHGIRIHEMTEGHLALLFSTYRTRMEQLYATPRIKSVLVFKNFGPAAGASIAHTHSQIIAMPVVPDNVQAEVRNSSAFFEAQRHCIFCSLIDEALTFEATLYDRDSGELQRKISVGQFVIDRSKRFIAIKPFASRYEWEVHILPLGHQADFLDASPEDLADLAVIFKKTMVRLNAVLGGASQYNYFLHSVPHGKEYDECGPSFHWHIEICPRTSIPTGFELGSGLFVNTICPEDAAERLRNVQFE